jgi:hypothetical protein
MALLRFAGNLEHYQYVCSFGSRPVCGAALNGGGSRWAFEIGNVIPFPLSQRRFSAPVDNVVNAPSLSQMTIDAVYQTKLTGFIIEAPYFLFIHS